MNDRVEVMEDRMRNPKVRLIKFLKEIQRIRNG